MLPIPESIEAAAAAEAAGFDSVWVGELQQDPFVVLAAISRATSRLRLGTAIAGWTRTPATMQRTATTLDELSGGRFILGLGSLARSVSEDLHGIAYERPVQRMREYVEVLRLMWDAPSGQPWSYQGQHFRVHADDPFVRNSLSLRQRPWRERIPIYLGAVQQRMTELAAELADGIIMHTMHSIKSLEQQTMPWLEHGWRRAGRDPSTFEIAAGVFCVVASRRADAVRLAKHAIAFYCTLPYIRPVLERHGFGTAVRRVVEAQALGDQPGMVAAVPDEAVASLAIAGTPDDCRRQLAAYAGRLSLVHLSTPSMAVPTDQRVANVRAIIETFAG